MRQFWTLLDTVVVYGYFLLFFAPAVLYPEADSFRFADQVFLKGLVWTDFAFSATSRFSRSDHLKESFPSRYDVSLAL